MSDFEVIGTEYSLNWFQRVLTWMYTKWVWEPMLLDSEKRLFEDVLTPEDRAYMQKVILEGGDFDGVYRTDH